MLADLIGDFLVAQIAFNPDTELARGIDLQRREPQGQMAGVVLHKDSSKALERAKDCAVDHHRRDLLAFRPDVVSVKAAGKVEIDLTVPHCHSRPMASRKTYSSFGP